jgi:hypothetical protein
MAKVSKPLADRVSRVCCATVTASRTGPEVMLSSWRIAGELGWRYYWDGSTSSAELICARANEVLRRIRSLRRENGGQHDLITAGNDAWFYEVRR